jgi:formylglycine-generating enzyme required for sulfatase activity
MNKGKICILAFLLLGSTPAAGQTPTPVVETVDGVEMVLVPAGCFEMGSTDGEPNERPVHQVCFEQPFWIDRLEVTHVDNRYPQVDISWEEAQTYCHERGARLPTEAEWEYAARGPDNPIYPWGNEYNKDFMAYAYTSQILLLEVGTAPQGASWVGAEDLSGNAFEWVADWYRADYYGTLEDGAVSPQGPESGEYRVVRGGGLESSDDEVRSANRFWFPPDAPLYNVGFRCVRED